MELFIDGKRYKDFYHRVTVEGIEKSKELIDVNEVRFRMMGWEKEFQRLLSGKTLAFVRSEPDYTTITGWNEVAFRTDLKAEK